MGGERTSFVDEVAFHEGKCRQHLARTKLALLLGSSAATNRELMAHPNLVELAIGPGEQTSARVEEALTRSLFLDLKVNFELFLWTGCRSWLRWEFVASMRRLSQAQIKVPRIRDFLKDKSFADVFDEDVEDFLPSHGLDLLLALVDALTPGNVGSIDPQIHVAFAVRHAVEHRNGRMDQKFVTQCRRVWSDTTWRDVELRVDGLVLVRSDDFAKTYEAMDRAAQQLASRMSAAWVARP